MRILGRTQFVIKVAQQIYSAFDLNSPANMDIVSTK